jgi:hypothetical protein
MSTFSIDEVALAEIRRIFGRSTCLDPVASLFERADAGHLFDEIKTAFLDGARTTEDLSAMARDRYREVAGQIKSSLAVDVVERADFRSEDLFEIGGVTFVIGAQLLEMLSDYRLMFERDRFYFRGADNTEHTLRSLARTQKRR